jgi:ankyrin repeat protein
MVSFSDANGCTPLILALLAGNKQAVRRLIHENCDISPVGTVAIMDNKMHVNALDICITHGLIDMFELLIEAGAKLDCAKYFEKIFGDPTYLTDLPPLLRSLSFHLSNASPLMRLCRTNIRCNSNLGPRPNEWITQLGLPRYLMHYILLESELCVE